jgi:aryl-alcohol dehydrogenase-like predicted oxidoreductase
MKTRKLGSLEVSEISYGCMGLNYHRGPAKDRNEMIKLVHSVIDMGITMLDTAEVYGPYINEELVGEAISGQRDKLVIASKCGFVIKNGEMAGLDSRPVTMRKALEGSLTRLKTDYIDLFYIHRVDPNVPIEEVAQAMQQFKREGKIRHWGLSGAPAETVRKAHGVEPLTAVQNEYSIWRREDETELFPTLEKLGIGLVAYSPLGRGFLTGTIAKDKDFSVNDNRAWLPWFSQEGMEANQVLLNYLAQLAKEKNASLAQVSIAWILAQKPWIVPIPGSTRLERVQENNDSVKVTFSKAELEKIDEALSKIEIFIGEMPAFPGSRR